MASPQLENGYIRIANEVIEKLSYFPFPEKTGVPIRLVFFVIRKTWGYQKKTDIISLSQFVKGLDSNRPTVVHWLEYLVKAGLLIKGKEVNRIGIEYSFNKDWEQWKWLVKASELVKVRPYTSKGALTKTSKGALTHKRHKETITKDTEPSSDTKMDIDYNTGEIIDEKPKTHKREDAIALATLFDKMASSFSKKPISTPKSYFIILNAINKHGLKPKGIEKLFKDWFNNEKIKPENKVKLNFALSADNINAFKVLN